MKHGLLIEIEPGRFRTLKPATAPARSALPTPYVISDEMPPTEQVDGRSYTSKAKFRAVGRELGLTEVGNEKLPPKQRATATKPVKEARYRSLRTAMEKYKAGQRPGGRHA